MDLPFTTAVRIFAPIARCVFRILDLWMGNFEIVIF